MAETLRRWCREAEGRRSEPVALAVDERDRLKLLEREVIRAAKALSQVELIAVAIVRSTSKEVS